MAIGFFSTVRVQVAAASAYSSVADALAVMTAVPAPLMVTLPVALSTVATVGALLS